MGLFSKKNNDVVLDEEINEIPKNHIKDDWVRSDYILVSNKTSAKDLKPYQRMVVLRKPTGQQKYIVDKSLPYGEIKKLQNLIEKRQPVDINSSKIKRIIPNEYKTYEEIDNDSIINYEDDLNVLKDLNSGEFNEHLVDNEITSLLKLEDDFSRISLKSKTDISGVNDVEIIDSVKIYIPHEERKIKWDTIDGDQVDDGINELIKNQDNEVLEENYNDNLVLESDYEIYNQANQSDYDNNGEPIASDEVFLTNEEESLYENYETNLIQDELYLNSEENQGEVVSDYQVVEEQEKDYDGEILTTNTYVEKPKQTITSFFKNEIEISDYAIQDQQRRNNYYRFYNDTNNMPMEKVVLNKKANMFTMRRKIDKNLIEQKSRKY